MSAVFPRVFATPQYALLEVQGEDAATFLYSMLAGELPATSGAWVFGALLNYKGQLIQSFHLIRVDQKTFRLLLTEDTYAYVKNELAKRVFRAKVVLTTITLEAGYLAQASFSKEEALPLTDGKEILPLAGGFALSFGSGMGMLHCIQSTEAYPHTALLASSSNEGSDDSQQAFEAWCVCHTFIPIRKESIATHLALRVLSCDIQKDAISLSKGCYPGQEIIARTTHLGKQTYTVVSKISSAEEGQLSKQDDSADDGHECFAVVYKNERYALATVRSKATD